MASVIGELSARAVDHAEVGEVIGVKVGKGGAFGLAAVGGVVSEELEFATSRHAGAVARGGIGTRGASPHAVA